jgi:hypothetical protein
MSGLLKNPPIREDGLGGGATASIAVASATESLGGIGVNYTGRQYKFASIGASLTAQQALDQYTDVAAFFTAIASL